MRINATMTSPVIIVPRSSRSKEHLEIDLGDLTVTNEHKTVLVPFLVYIHYLYV